MMTFANILERLLIEAIIPGVSSVLSFIPAIAILIFILTFLRESGLVRSDLAPLFMGFSCSVPAIIACSTIEDKRRRLLIMFLIPYISCSAKLPIYVMLSSVFFPLCPMAAILGVYLIGISIAAASLFAYKHLGMQSAHAPRSRLFLSLRKPSLHIMFDAVVTSCLGFIKKAFTIILAASVIIWFLQNIDSSFHFTSDIENSLLASMGRFFSPLFAPLGFGDWRAATALICGVSSKESVVSTFAVLAGSSEISPGFNNKTALVMMLEEIFTPASAASFMAFCLLYVPCVGTLAAIRNTSGSLRITSMLFIIQTIVAWCVSFLIFHFIKAII